jgi:hypothetical protein
MGGKTRIDVVSDALLKIAVKMVQRSTKGTTVSPRYRIAMFAYSSEVIDVLIGIKTISELAKMGIPKFVVQDVDMADTAAAFAEAEKLLRAELPDLQDCPAPLVCHVTDGKYDATDPTPVAERIMAMRVPDGNVLIENVLLTLPRVAIPKNKSLSGLLARLAGREPTSNVVVPESGNWPGFTSKRDLPDQSAKTLTLFQISSPIPKTYLSCMREFGYQLDLNARMLFPGDRPDVVELAFAVWGGVTLVTRAD